MSTMPMTGQGGHPTQVPIYCGEPTNPADVTWVVNQYLAAKVRLGELESALTHGLCLVTKQPRAHCEKCRRHHPGHLIKELEAEIERLKLLVQQFDVFIAQVRELIVKAT